MASALGLVKIVPITRLNLNSVNMHQRLWNTLRNMQTRAVNGQGLPPYPVEITMTRILGFPSVHIYSSKDRSVLLEVSIKQPLLRMGIMGKHRSLHRLRCQNSHSVTRVLTHLHLHHTLLQTYKFLYTILSKMCLTSNSPDIPLRAIYPIKGLFHSPVN